jgi:hypothetical protein
MEEKPEDLYVAARDLGVQAFLRKADSRHGIAPASCRPKCFRPFPAGLMFNWFSIAVCTPNAWNSEFQRSDFTDNSSMNRFWALTVEPALRELECIVCQYAIAAEVRRPYRLSKIRGPISNLQFLGWHGPRLCPWRFTPGVITPAVTRGVVR